MALNILIQAIFFNFYLNDSESDDDSDCPASVPDSDELDEEPLSPLSDDCDPESEELDCEPESELL